MLSQVLGGVGLFLIGMLLTTDGLKSAAGDSLRRVLLRFAGKPMHALLSGAFVTALVQSSSATTVATISFVTAGVLSFQQALGLIFGANIGTTATGWIVATLGLKFSVSKVALPLVGVGALIRLFGRGRARDIGMALAGFGVLFVGLDVLQAGMAGASDFITPDSLPSDTWLGRVALVGIGALLTAVMQSSSAAIATTLTALHAETISMMQAAAMAIGVNIGTTVTAGIAVLGAGTAARRTAVAHLLFNLVTGVVAFASLPILVRVATTSGGSDPTIALAAFHTIFNIVGVAIVLPFTGRFAAFVERIVPETENRLTRRLSSSLVDDGVMAIEAARRTAIDIAQDLVVAGRRIAVERTLDEDVRGSIRECCDALDATQAFVAAIRNLDSVGAQAQERLVDLVHALDYLHQLADMLRREGDALIVPPPPHATPARDCVAEVLERTGGWLDEPRPDPELVTWLESQSTRLADDRRTLRAEVLEKAARGQYSAVDAGRDVELLRRLDELAYHVWRFVARLAR